jgi:GH25 family lysozyme M1 (1,4-beta-N-acetylmuramidase)
MIDPGGRVTLFGWDASDFDWSRGPMDLGAAKADGITWFTHKATESTNVRHVHLADALTRARSAGFEFLGAYHVIRSSPSVDAQVNYFLGTLDQQVPWWRDFPGFMLQVDLELWSYDQVSASTGIAFANALVAAQPKKVITYASRGMYGNSLVGLPTPLWNAAYGTDPAVHYRQAYPGDNGIGWTPYSGQTPVMWQYGSRLTIGSQPGCDANAFRGSLADLRQLITGSTATTTRKAPDMFRVLDPDNEQFVVQFTAFGWAWEWLDGTRRDVMEAAGVPLVRDVRPGVFGNENGYTAVRQRFIDELAAKVVASLPPGGGTAGPTLAQITAAVRSELDKTKLTGPTA